MAEHEKLCARRKHSRPRGWKMSNIMLENFFSGFALKVAQFACELNIVIMKWPACVSKINKAMATMVSVSDMLLSAFKRGKRRTTVWAAVSGNAARYGMKFSMKINDV